MTISFQNALGHVAVSVKLANPVRGMKVKLAGSALVDTGATFTTISEKTVRKLGLKSIGKRRVSTAAKTQILNESYAYIEVNGRSCVTPLLVSKTLDKILIGVMTLEALGLSLDPTRGTLRGGDVTSLASSFD